MSKRLATINTNVPIEFSMDELTLEEPDYESLIEIYTKLEFNSFLKKLKVPAKAETSQFTEMDVTKEILENREEVSEKLAKLRGEIYLKVFGNMSHTELPYIEGVFLMDDASAYYIDAVKIPPENIAEILNKFDFHLIGHEIKDDIYCLMSADLRILIYYSIPPSPNTS
ncbi:MAG: hypothetical protein ACLTK0_01655 [Anaerovoracaceae bacterium]